MLNTTKILFAVIAIFLAIVNSSHQRSTVRLRNRECDDMFSKTTVDIKYILLYEGNIHSLEDVANYCTVATNSFNMIKKFSSHCLEPLNKQIVTVFLKSLKKALRSICRGEDERKAVLEAMQCSTPTLMENWRNCLDQSNRQLDNIAKNSTIKDLWGDLCCVQIFHKECVDKLEMLSGCEYKENNIKSLLDSLFELLMKDVSDIGCGKFRTRLECHNNSVGRMERLKKIAASRRRINTPLFIGPIIDILGKLTD